jgi:hypothetical protein
MPKKENVIEDLGLINGMKKLVKVYKKESIVVKLDGENLNEIVSTTSNVLQGRWLLLSLWLCR